MTENQKFIQSSHRQDYLTILHFTSLKILLRLSGYFLFVLELLQISLMYFTHFSAKMFIIFLLIGEGSLHIKVLNPLLYTTKLFWFLALMKGMLPTCVYINSLIMCILSF